MTNLSDNSRISNPVFWCSLFYHPHYEVWKPIVGYEGLYEVSSYGRAKSLAKTIINGKNGSRKTHAPDRFLKPCFDSKYLRVVLYKNSKGISASIHRILAIALIENQNSLPQVNHIDGVKTNNHISNLEWCTPSYNNIHAFKLGLSKSNAPKGISHHRAAFTNDDILSIRERLKNNELGTVVAREYGVSKNCIYSIKNRKNWQHL